MLLGAKHTMTRCDFFSPIFCFLSQKCTKNIKIGSMRRIPYGMHVYYCIIEIWSLNHMISHGHCQNHFVAQHNRKLLSQKIHSPNFTNQINIKSAIFVPRHAPPLLPAIFLWILFDIFFCDFRFLLFSLFLRILKLVSSSFVAFQRIFKASIHIILDPIFTFHVARIVNDTIAITFSFYWTFWNFRYTREEEGAVNACLNVIIL